MRMYNINFSRFVFINVYFIILNYILMGTSMLGLRLNFEAFAEQSL